MIVSDQPITHRKNDTLGYGPFAEALAKSIAGLHFADCLVIGINGAWGMGKTSAVNLALESLKLHQGKSQRDTVEVVIFRPWNYSGQENLTQAFFSVLAEKIKKPLGDQVADGARNVARFFQRAGEPLEKLVTSVAAAADLAGAGGIASGTVLAIKALPKKFLADRTLDQARKRLIALLNKADRRLLVVVDDIDRLLAAEIRQLLAMVKSVADLPNTTYVLVFDRQIVESVMDDGDRRASGQPSFLEKIVQVPLDLPAPSKTGLQRMFLEKLEGVFGDATKFTADTWGGIVDVALDEYMKSPRDIVRLSNALAVVWPSVAGEVYPVDLVGIELTRCFEPNAYNLIRGQREFLTGIGGPSGAGMDEALAKEMLESFSNARSHRAADLLTTLFPRLKKYTCFERAFVNNRGSWIPSNGRRLSDADGFDAFFRFAPSSDALTVKEIKDLRKTCESEELLRKSMSNALSRKNAWGSSFAGIFLDSIKDILRDDRECPTGAVLTILLELGERLIASRDAPPSDFFPTSNTNRLFQIWPYVVVGLPSETRADLLKVAISRQASSLSAAAQVVDRLARPHGRVRGAPMYNDDQPLVSNEVVEIVAATFLQRVRDQAKTTGKLKSSADVAHVLRIWASMSSTAEVAEWVARAIEKDAGFACRIAIQLMTEVRSSSPPYSYRQLAEIPDGETYDLSDLATAVSRGLKKVTDSDDARDLGNFVIQLRKHLADEREEEK